jgi:hypothetical protein
LITRTGAAFDMNFQIGDILVAKTVLDVFDANGDVHPFDKGSYFVVVSTKPKDDPDCHFVIVSQLGRVFSEWYENDVDRCFIKEKF